MSGLAQRERMLLCDTFDTVGPDAPTLCGSWRTADLAAHLVIRESRPDTAVGIVVPMLASRTEKIQAEYAAKPWPALVDLVRAGPPVWNPAGAIRVVDDLMNLVEFYVHHEDVLRAEASGPQRTIPAPVENALWKALNRMGRLLVRRADVGVQVEAPGHRPHTLKNATGTGAVTLSGRPSELVLALFGRAEVADLGWAGTDAEIAAFKSSPLGI